LAETLASLPQELERGGEGALRSGALRIGVVLFDEACLKSRSDIRGRFGVDYVSSPGAVSGPGAGAVHSAVRAAAQDRCGASVRAPFTGWG